MKNINLTIITATIFGLSVFWGCNKDECAYILGNPISNPCVEAENLFEDFDSIPLNGFGNWQEIGTLNSGVNSAGEMYTEDGPIGSYLFNLNDFPADLVGAGCELRYDVKYEDIVGGSPSNNKSVWIFDGPTPYTGSNFAAKFELNPSNLLNNGTAFVTIVVPLDLGNDNPSVGPLSLPSNSFGEWKIVSPAGSGNEHNSVPLTQALVSQFNDRISGVSGGTGVGFLLDLQGSPNPDERWWFDNFYIKTCCPTSGPT